MSLQRCSFHSPKALVCLSSVRVGLALHFLTLANVMPECGSKGGATSVRTQRSKTLCTAGLTGQMNAGPKAFTHRSLLHTSFQRALLCFAAIAQSSHLKGRSPGGQQRSKRSTVLQSQLPMQRGSLISTTAWWSKVRTLMTLCLSSCRALSNSLL